MMDRSFYIEAKWGSRVETPEVLAERFLHAIDGFATIHSALHLWTWGDYQDIRETEGERGAYPFTDIRPQLVAAIARNMAFGDDDQPDPYSGYFLCVKTQGAAPRMSVNFLASVGARPTGGSSVMPFTNWIDFEIGPDPDPSLTTYPFWRAALLLIAETWEATWAHASPADIRSIRSGETFDCAWMSTISPRFAPLITPPPNVIVEHRPDGGLFCAATQDTFRTADPRHVAAARSIAAALEPLNRLPYPIDDPYR